MAYPTSQIVVPKVDNVDDVLAIHVNELQTAAVNMRLRYITNTSGSTVAVGDVGYIDYAGEFKLTTTAYLEAAWAVVVVGGVNTADIIVAIGGSKVLVELNGNCSAGDYLYTSTTSKQAQPQSYMRPEVFAVATTANSSGAGGTCEALLLCQRKFFKLTSTNDIINLEAVSDSDWQTTQNGAVAGAVVTYNVPLTNGAEDAIVPQSSSELGNLVLHNTTQAAEAYIDSVNIGANTITVTDAADIVGWNNTDVLEVRSPTMTFNDGTSYAFDVEILDTEVPTLTTAVRFYWDVRDTGAADLSFLLHPWEADVTSKRYIHNNQVANISYRAATALVDLKQRRFVIWWQASGVGTARFRLKLMEVVVAAP